MPAVADMTIEADLARLETSIRQLKVQYDMFLAGALPRQPYELREQVERLIKQYSHASIRKYQHRFHLGALVARFNSLSELWGKTLREREEGNRRVPAAADLADKRDTALSSYQLTGSNRDEAELRRLHAVFVETRKRVGAGAEVPFEAFARKVSARAEGLRQKTGCDHVELKLEVNDSKVILKARPRG